MWPVLSPFYREETKDQRGEVISPKITQLVSRGSQDSNHSSLAPKPTLLICILSVFINDSYSGGIFSLWGHSVFIWYMVYFFFVVVLMYSRGMVSAPKAGHLFS